MTSTIDLDICAKEPIHIPGSIQPHGVMFVLEAGGTRVVQVSANCEAMLGVNPERILRDGLGCVLTPPQLAMARSALASADPLQVNPVDLDLLNEQTGERFAGIVHRYDGFDFLELEPGEEAADSRFLEFYKKVSRATDRMQTAPEFGDLFSAAANAVGQATGYSRVMIYRFSASGQGEVIGESKSEGMESFLGLRYPASDIPEQARRMYTLSPIRCIPDARYVPVPLVPLINPISGKPTDMSFASLRSVSPIHREYLQNMGVAASMSVSILRNGSLWGLIAAHHDAAKNLGYETRKACTFLGQVLSGEIARREAEEAKNYLSDKTGVLSRLLAMIAGSPSCLAALGEDARLLQDLIPCDGVAVLEDGKVWSAGFAPGTGEVLDLSESILQMSLKGVFATTQLKYAFPSLERLRTAGVMVLEIARDPLKLVYFFRRDVPQTVNWAGNPEKAVSRTEDGLRVSPRKSFALWKEEVHATSEPWKKAEIGVAEELREVLRTVEVKQRLALRGGLSSD